MKKTPASGSITRCQICKNNKLLLVLSLGHHPILQRYLSEKQLREPETTYPLNLVYCSTCGLSQLNYCIDPALLFNQNYPYRTGLTNMLRKNFDALAGEMFDTGYYQQGDLVVDIGSNDGTLLEQFKKRGALVLGVEPTGAAQEARRADIRTLQEFFTKKTVSTIKEKYGVPQIITATNVFAHIVDLSTLLNNIKHCMGKNSVFVSESQYLVDIIEKVEFDTVYDEHLRYYSLKPMIRMFSMHGMSLVDAEHISAAGGSIRVYAKTGNHAMSKRAKELLKKEQRLGLYKRATLAAFARQAHRAKNDLMALLLKQKRNGKTIAALTSAGRSNTLLNFAKIDTTLIDYIGEKKSSPKIGLYTPGSHIPVVDEFRIIEKQPDYLLVLSWHIGAELIQIMRKMGYKGKFIIPLPNPRIVT